MTDALKRLPERERVVLRLHLVNGVSLEKVGKMFGVSTATVSRWLAAAREALRDDIKRTLGARLGSNSTEIASLAGMVASRLDMSISMILQANRSSPRTARRGASEFVYDPEGLRIRCVEAKETHHHHRHGERT